MGRVSIRRYLRRGAPLVVASVALCLFVFAAGSAFAATFTGAAPANGTIIGDPAVSPTVNVLFQLTITADAGKTLAPAPNPDWAWATLSIDGGPPTQVGASWNITGYDDAEYPIYDYTGASYYAYHTLTTNQQHTLVLTVMEQPGGTTTSHTWTVGQAVRPENCATCHSEMPGAHPMGACASCHFPGGPITYHNGGFPAFNTCGRSVCHGVSSHGPDRLGPHTYYDLDGNPYERAGRMCTYCHSETRYPTVPMHGDVGQGTKWSYKDLYDANEKYEGGYDCVTCHDSQPSFSPHGGYDTTTNKCKVCHAVHRAEGAYYLLRADSQDDACEYCHLDSAHSATIVYDNGGRGTPNGHTIGAATYIPDSTVAQWTEPTTLETVDEHGQTISETINVRAYSPDKNDMYRFARHHGHSAATGAARRNYVPVGPLALRCMSCHQVHNATAQTWQSISSFGNAGEYTGDTKASYKLLKQFPSGTFVGALDTYGQVPIGNISLVPETTLTAGTNFDDVRAQGTDPTSLDLVRDFNGDGDAADAGETVAFNKPMWVAQGFDGDHDRTEPFAEEAIASAVNNAALSVWCADCHNLNIGGWKKLANPEVGYKAHAERTHPAPYTGAHSGPGQCYSCHRADLPRINTGDACSQCHYGTGNYRENRGDPNGAEYVASDFPHTGDGSYKMLGNYSVQLDGTDAGRTTPTSVTVGPDSLDAICVRCHGGVGTYH